MEQLISILNGLRYETEAEKVNGTPRQRVGMVELDGPSAYLHLHGPFIQIAEPESSGNGNVGETETFALACYGKTRAEAAELADQVQGRIIRPNPRGTVRFALTYRYTEAVSSGFRVILTLYRNRSAFR